MIEDLKIQVYSKDKIVELQQEQINHLIEDLKEAKQFEYKAKTLQIQLNSLDGTVEELKRELTDQVIRDARSEPAAG